MNIFSSFSNYFRGVYSETRKVVWPTRRQTINNTLLVVVSVAIAVVIFGLVDLGLSSLISILLQR